MRRCRRSGLRRLEVKLEKLIVRADDKAVDEALANLAASAQNFEDRKKGSRPRTAIRW